VITAPHEKGFRVLRRGVASMWRACSARGLPDGVPPVKRAKGMEAHEARGSRAAMGGAARHRAESSYGIPGCVHCAHIRIEPAKACVYGKLILKMIHVRYTSEL
jgi:hypothetical protein